MSKRHNNEELFMTFETFIGHILSYFEEKIYKMGR